MTTTSDPPPATETAPPPRRSFGQATVERVRRPGTPTQLVLIIALAALTVWTLTGSPFLLLVGQSCAVYAVASLGQWLLIGRAGQVAISGAAFMAIGAFATGMLADTPLKAFPIPVVVSALVGLAVGLVSGLPGIRFRGLYLLLASVALQYIVASAVQIYQLSHAPSGLVVPPLQIGSLDLSTGRPLFLALLVVLAVVLVAVLLVDRTGVGLAWRALRESEVAAAVSGVDATRWKLYAFALSGAITAVAGSLLAYVVGVVDYQTFSIGLSITLLTMTFVGGVRSILGTLIGAVVITALPYVLQQHLSTWLHSLGLSAHWYTDNVSQVNAGLFSLIFMLVVLFSPTGLEGLVRRLETAVRRRSRQTSAPAAGGDAA